MRDVQSAQGKIFRTVAETMGARNSMPSDEDIAAKVKEVSS